MTTTITRFDLQLLQGMSPKLLRAFEQLFVDTATATEAIAGQVAATGAIQNATVLTLSSNAAFANERIVYFNMDQFLVEDEGAGNNLSISLASPITLNGGFQCTFNLRADTNITLPALGRVPSSADGPYADDAAAAAAGINVGEIYKGPTGTVVWRQT